MIEKPLSKCIEEDIEAYKNNTVYRPRKETITKAIYHAVREYQITVGESKELLTKLSIAIKHVEGK